MELTLSQIKDLLVGGFEEGSASPYTMREQAIELVMEKCKGQNKARVYKVAELRALPAGTTFFHTHPALGKGVIVHADGKQYMQFEKNNKKADFTSDWFPWTDEMTMM